MPDVPSQLPAYRFAVGLVLSDDATLEAVLSDIPLFSVGIVAFGISTFFVVMKRVNLIAIYLYSSALIAFAAAILDLSQILARGTSNTTSALSVTALVSLVNTREVLLALSTSFRFLFFWAFIAERPRGEPPPPPRESRTEAYDPREHAHSASWQRWGYLGFLLKWTLLGLSIAILALQIIWRIAERRYATVYMVESTIEIVASGLFILKILLNVFLSPLVPWWRPLRSYSAPLLALLINAGVGIGNLIMFAFSETTLGRFLQAIELYILILYVLIAAFYGVPGTVRATQSRRSEATSSFAGVREKPRESTFSQVEKPPNREIVLIGRPYSGMTTPPVESARGSVVSRVSSWLSRPARRPRSGERQLWDGNTDDPELGRTNGGAEQDGTRENDAEQIVTVANTLENLSPRVEELRGQMPRSPLAIFNTAISTPPRSPRTPMSAGAKSDRTPMQETFPNNRPITEFSVASYYGMDRGSRMSYPNPAFLSAVSRDGNDSPIYGLNGIIRPDTKRLSKASSIRPDSKRASRVSTLRANSMSSFDELLRQQTELDRSIAALRLFSPEPTETTFPEPPQIPKTAPVRPGPSVRSTSNSTGSLSAQRLDSASARSEFSLSIFPEPPLSTAPPSPSATTRVPRGREEPSLPPPRRIRDENAPSLPSSPNQPMSSDRFGSAGTQYEITSFIGDLTAPRPSGEFMRNSIRLSDVESEDESSPTIVTAGSSQNLRPMVLNTAMPIVTSTPSFPPATASSGLLTSTSSRSRDRESTLTPILKPFFLGNVTSTPNISSPLSSGAVVHYLPNTKSANRITIIAPTGPRRPLRGLTAASRGPGIPSRPRLNISAPRPSAPDGQGDQAPGAFERPRPPPLMLSPSERKERKDSKKDTRKRGEAL